MLALHSAHPSPQTPLVPSSSIDSLEKDELKKAVKKEWNLNKNSTGQELPNNGKFQVLGGSPPKSQLEKDCIPGYL